MKAKLIEGILWLLCLTVAVISAITNVEAKETDDLRYMTEAIYFESGTEPDICKLMVAKVINERVSKSFWKNTVEEVVHQVSKKGTCQFSYYCDNKPEVMDYDSETYRRSYEVANWALYREDIPDEWFGGADHFINHALSDKDWHTDMEFIAKCGGHSFYRSNIK